MTKKQKLWRYQKRATLTIRAGADRVYSIASDPDRAPEFAPEIRRIVDVRPLEGGDRLMECRMQTAGVPYRRLFRYRRRAGKLYGGDQHGGGILRGYFAFAFLPHPAGTEVVHVEGLRSRVPLLAWLVGSIYYGVFARRKLDRELERLAALAD